LDNGEFQPLHAAASFEFLHKADLTFDDGTTKDFPILTDALQLSMEGGERYADRTHTYSNIDSEAFIDKDRNYVGNVRLEGKNESGGVTNYIPLTFTAVGAQYFEECKCRAIDVNAGTDLAIEPMERRPLQLFACRIYFQNPLPPDQEFHIEVRFQLDKVMLDENDYDMLSLMRFSRRVRDSVCCPKSR
jgi:hypothetical protein